MTPATARVLVRRVGPDPELPADAELVGRFARTADPAAFADLVRRHGPMVLAACRRMLPSSADADDAFQAVFVVLLRKAGAVRPAGAVGGWLHGVAVRTAQKARVAAARRRRREMNTLASPVRESGVSAVEHAELCAVLDEELAKLPEPLRAAVVLCDLGGKTRAEAAADLGCPEGTVAARVFRARKVLAERLTRRGVTAPAVVAAAAVPAELFAAVAGFAAGGSIPSAVRALADGVVRGLAAQPLSLALAALAAVAVAVGSLWAAGPAPSEAAAVPDPAPVAAAPVGLVYQLGYSADGSKLVFVGGGKALVRDAATGTERFAADAAFAQFGGDGKSVFAFDKDRFRTLDAATGKELATASRDWDRTEPIRWAAASPDGSVQVVADGLAHAANGPPVPQFTVLFPGQFSIYDAEHRLTPRVARGGAFSPDGKRYAGVHAADRERTKFGLVGVWDARIAGDRVGTIARGKAFFELAAAVAWSPDGKRLAVGFGDGTRVYDADTLTELRALDTGHATAVAWSADGRQLAVATTEDELAPGVAARVTAVRAVVGLFDPDRGARLRRVEGFAENLPVVALAFRPDGKELACGSGFLPGDGPRPELPPPAKDAVGLRLVALDPPPAVRAHVTALSFAPDGMTYLVVASGKAVVKDFATDRVLWDAPAEAARFTADGAAVTTLGKEVARREAATGKVLKSFPRTKTDLHPHVSAVSPDGSRYASQVGFAARLFDTATGAPVRLDPDHGMIGSALLLPFGEDVQFSPDGRLLAAVGVHLGTGDVGAVVWDAATGKERFVFPPPGNPGRLQPVTAAAFSADGKTLAVAIEWGVHLFDTAGFKHAGKLDDTPGSGPVTALAFAPDGKSLAVGYRLPLFHGGEKKLRVVGHKTEVQVIELATRKELRRFDGFEGVSHMGPTVLPVTALAFAPDGNTLLAGTGVSAVQPAPAGKLPPGEVKRFALADPPAKAAAPTWREQGMLPPFEDRVHSVAFSPDGKSLAVGGRGGAAQHTVTMWDAAARRKLWASGPVPAGTTGVSFSRDGRLLAATRDKTTGLYDTITGRPELMNPPLPGGKATAFSHAAERVAGQARRKLAVTDGRMVAVLDWAEGVPVSSATFGPLKDGPKVEGELPVGVAFAPSGRQLVFIPNHKIDPAYFAGKVAAPGPATHWVAHVWGGGSGEAMAPLPHGTAPVTAVAWSPDGKQIASGCRLGDVVVWDAATYKELRRTRLGGRGGEGEIRALAFAPDGKTLAAAVNLNEGRNVERVVMLDPITGGRLGTDLQGFGNFSPVSLAFAPDGRTLAVGLADFLPQVQLPPGGVHRPLGSVVLFTTDPEPKAAPTPAPTPDAEASFAPDGKTYLVVASGKAAVKDAVTDRVLWEAAADAARFTADGKAVMTLGATVTRSDAATGKVLKEWPRPKDLGPWRAAAFSPDGGRLAVHLADRARVFDVALGHDLIGYGPIVPELALPPAGVSRLVWSPDGGRLAATGLPVLGGGRRGVALWDTASGTALGPSRADGVPGAEARALAFSPDGRTLAVATQHDVYLWADGAKAPRREALLGDLGAVGFLADGRLVAAGEGRYADGKSDPPVYERRLFAHVIDRKQAYGGYSAIDPKTVRPAGAPPVTALAVSPDGKTVLVSAGGVTRLTFAPPAAPDPPVVWSEKVTLPPLDDAVHALAFRPDGKELAAGGRRGLLTAWSLPDGVQRHQYLYEDVRVPTPVAYSPDGKVFGHGVPDGFLPLDAPTWNLLPGVSTPGRKLAFPLVGPTPRAVAFGLPGPGVAGRPRYKAAATDGGGAMVYTWVEGGPVAIVPFDRPKNAPKLDDPVAAVAFSPSGEQLVFIPNAKDAAGLWVAQVWGGGGKAASHVLPHGPAPLTAAAWSPDGKYAATGCRKGDVVIWDVTTFKELRRVALTGRTGEGVVYALAFAPDGKTLAAAVDLIDGKNVDRVVILDPATGERAARDIQGFSNAEPRALAFAPDGKTLAVGFTAYRVENFNRVGDHGLVKLYAAAPGR